MFSMWVLGLVILVLEQPPLGGLGDLPARKHYLFTVLQIELGASCLLGKSLTLIHIPSPLFDFVIFRQSLIKSMKLPRLILNPLCNLLSSWDYRPVLSGLF